MAGPSSSFTSVCSANSSYASETRIESSPIHRFAQAQFAADIHLGSSHIPRALEDDATEIPQPTLRLPFQIIAWEEEKCMTLEDDKNGGMLAPLASHGLETTSTVSVGSSLHGYYDDNTQYTTSLAYVNNCVQEENISAFRRVKTSHQTGNNPQCHPAQASLNTLSQKFIDSKFMAPSRSESPSFPQQMPLTPEGHLFYADASLSTNLALPSGASLPHDFSFVNGAHGEDSFDYSGTGTSSHPSPAFSTATAVSQGTATDPIKSPHHIRQYSSTPLSMPLLTLELVQAPLESGFPSSRLSNPSRPPFCIPSSGPLSAAIPNNPSDSTAGSSSLVLKESRAKRSRVHGKKTEKKPTFPACEGQRTKILFFCRWGDCNYICDGLHDFKGHLQEEHDLSVGHSRTASVQCLWKGCGPEPHAHRQELFRHLCAALKIVVKCTKCGRKVRDEDFDLRSHLKRCYEGVSPNANKTDVWEEVLE